jgi:hypothetical protein
VRLTAFIAFELKSIKQRLLKLIERSEIALSLGTRTLIVEFKGAILAGQLVTLFAAISLLDDTLAIDASKLTN